MQYNRIEYKSRFIRSNLLLSALMIASQLSISPLPLRSNCNRGNIQEKNKMFKTANHRRHHSP